MRFAINPFTDQLDIVSQTGSGTAPIETISGNSGGAVGPDPGTFNINFVGDNTTGLTVVGSPGSFTLTVQGLASSTTQVGTTRFATNAEAAAQTSGTVALTPSNITSMFSTSPLPSSQGGTGLSSPAANQLIVTNGSSAYTLLGVAGNGQLPIGSIGSDPVLGNLTSIGGTLTITNGPGTINLDLVGGGAGVDSFSPDTGTDPVVPSAGGLVDIQGQATPNVSGIQVTGGLNRLDLAMFSPFGGGDFGFVASDNGGTQTVFVENTSNTASSDAAFSSIVGGTSAGDPYSHWVIPATRFYAAGIDNSDSDTWKLTTDVSPVSPSTGSTLLSMTSAGVAAIVNNLTQTAAISGGSLSTIISNTSNTASATAFHQVQVAGATASDAFYEANISGGQAWTWGLDNSDSDAFVISATATPGTTNIMRAAITGEINYPLQPAFLGVLGTNDSNVTGNGASYVLGSGNALTEVFDQNGDFVTTGTFTAPVTGKYFICANYVMGDVTAAMTFQAVNLTTSNRVYQFAVQNSFANATVAVAPGVVSSGGSALADMDSGDTFTTAFSVSGGPGNTVDTVVSGARLFMCGNLVC